MGYSMLLLPHSTWLPLPVDLLIAYFICSIYAMNILKLAASLFVVHPGIVLMSCLAVPAIAQDYLARPDH